MTRNSFERIILRYVKPSVATLTSTSQSRLTTWRGNQAYLAVPQCSAAIRGPEARGREEQKRVESESSEILYDMVA